MSNSFRILFIFFLSFNSLSLHASNYDDDILYIYSKLIPRFVLMSNQKIPSKDTINICILRESIDQQVSTVLIKKSLSNYPNGIKNYKLVFTQANFSNHDLCKNSELAFLFNNSRENITNFVKYSQKNNILTISYDNKMLKQGVDISLFIGRRIVPYLNMESISKKGIVLNNLLLRISKIYSKEKN